MFGIWLAIYIIRGKTVVLEAYAVYRERRKNAPTRHTLPITKLDKTPSKAPKMGLGSRKITFFEKK